MRSTPKKSDESEKGDEDVTAEVVIPAPSLLATIEINELGIEEEADDESPPKLEITPKKEGASSPEENKNPEVRKLRDKSNSFTPPPALSPAHSIQDVEMEEEEEEEEEVEEKPPKKTFAKPRTSGGMRKVESSPAIVRLEKEKRTYKKKDKSKEKDGVPTVDPNAPKRNRSAYVHFIISRRASYSKETMSQSNINISLAADWQKLSAEDRKPYHKMAEEEKTQYLKLMDEYKKTDSHKQFQDMRTKMLRSASRKRKNRDSDNDEGEERRQMDFPKTSVFCPLLNEPTSSATPFSGLQYCGPIFTPEFVAYNKTRDSYRRQLAIERSKLEHELEALNTHEEVKLQKQKDRIREVDEKTTETMKTMRSALSSIPEAKDHLSDIESLFAWLQTITKRTALRKKVHEALAKFAKK